VKVLSYNIREGGDGSLPAIAGVIRRQRPDAVALLEANSRANAEGLARELGMHLAFGEANCAYDVAWLSRSPIRRWENHRHPALAKTLLEIEVAREGMPLRLFAAHLASRHEPPAPADEIPVILDLLGPLVAQPHLLAGDLNALRPGDPVGEPPQGVMRRGDAAEGDPRTAIARLVAAGYVDCYRARHPRAPGYTYASDAPWLRLDYIFASPVLAARLAACDVVPGAVAARASDHLPLWAAFR
jgi:endonuclease/exonuclease/phosphatase family metal-dependent hydrolase